MNTISSYVKHRTNPHEYDVDEKIRRLSQRADRHQTESERLMQLGDLRHAETHANMARAHRRSAADLETKESVH
jgi:hypothetical protein